MNRTNQTSPIIINYIEFLTESNRNLCTTIQMIYVTLIEFDCDVLFSFFFFLMYTLFAHI